MRFQKTIVATVFAAFLLLASGLLQGLAWCASTVCETCGDDDNSKYSEIDSSLGYEGEGDGTSSSKQASSAQSSSSQSSVISHSGRNFVVKGHDSE